MINGVIPEELFIGMSRTSMSGSIIVPVSTKAAYLKKEAAYISSSHTHFKIKNTPTSGFIIKSLEPDCYSVIHPLGFPIHVHHDEMFQILATSSVKNSVIEDPLVFVHTSHAGTILVTAHSEVAQKATKSTVEKFTIRDLNYGDEVVLNCGKICTYYGKYKTVSTENYQTYRVKELSKPQIVLECKRNNGNTRNSKPFYEFIVRSANTIAYVSKKTDTPIPALDALNLINDKLLYSNLYATDKFVPVKSTAVTMNFKEVSYIDVRNDLIKRCNSGHLFCQYEDDANNLRYGKMVGESGKFHYKVVPIKEPFKVGDQKFEFKTVTQQSAYSRWHHTRNAEVEVSESKIVKYFLTDFTAK